MLGGLNVLETEERAEGWDVFSTPVNVWFASKVRVLHGLCYYQMFSFPDTCRQREETENVCSISFAFCILIK